MSLSTSTAKPLARIHNIDALRGFALAGVAVIHLVTEFVAGSVPAVYKDPSFVNWLDNGVFTFLKLFIDGKFFSIFSILFGLSFSIQMASAKRKGDNFALRFLWRSILLFGIGCFHQLFFRGDILMVYAFLSLFLIPFHRVKATWILLVGGIFLLSLPRLLVYFSFASSGSLGLVPAAGAAEIMQYYETLRSGTIGEVFYQNSHNSLLKKLDHQGGPAGRLYLTFGYFLLGLWIGKMGIFKYVEKNLGLLKRVLIGSVIALVLSYLLQYAVFYFFPRPVDLSKWQHVIGLNISDWVNTSLTLCIICCFILAFRTASGEKILSFFSPYGRMALTNYILQSIIGTFILFGWGLGFIGQIRPVILFFMACGLFTLQCLFSKFWLQNFRYGPLEWLWRSATYFKAQPFLKRRESVEKKIEQKQEEKLPVQV